MTASYRILIPSEYHALLDTIEKERLRIVVETMMNTGMRYSELERFSHNIYGWDKAPKWFDSTNRAITIPEGKSKTGKERVIHLTPVFSKRLYQYLREHKNIEVPSRRVMDENLKRWWFCDEGLHKTWHELSETWHPSCKTFRKTLESWLLATRREDGSSKYSYLEIAKSQGHTVDISEKYYANLDPRLKSEMDEVRKITEGWGT